MALIIMMLRITIAMILILILIRILIPARVRAGQRQEGEEGQRGAAPCARSGGHGALNPKS